MQTARSDLKSCAARFRFLARPLRWTWSNHLSSGLSQHDCCSVSGTALLSFSSRWTAKCLPMCESGHHMLSWLA